jgi:Na+-driven multidrug efflux pump
MISAAIMLVLICDLRKPIHIERIWRFEFHRDMVRRILSIGVPSGIENGMFHIGKLFVQGIIASFGTAQIAANAISSNICSMENIPGSAVGMAAVAIVGQCIGANEPGQAKYYSKKLLGIAFLSYLATAPIFLLSRDWMIGLYHVSEHAAELSMILIGSHVVAGTLIWPLAFTLPNFLRAAGDAKFPMVVSLASMWVFRVGFSQVLGSSLGMGVVGVWLAMYIDWICRSVFFVHRFRRGEWLKKRVI